MLSSMLSALLAERFDLAVHNDNQPLPAYALTAGPLRSASRKAIIFSSLKIRPIPALRQKEGSSS